MSTQRQTACPSGNTLSAHDPMPLADDYLFLKRGAKDESDWMATGKVKSWEFVVHADIVLSQGVLSSPAILSASQLPNSRSFGLFELYMASNIMYKVLSGVPGKNCR
jgi:hypothetical protein